MRELNRFGYRVTRESECKTTKNSKDYLRLRSTEFMELDFLKSLFKGSDSTVPNQRVTRRLDGFSTPVPNNILITSLKII